MGQVVEEGLDDILDAYFATPGDFYIGLCTDITIDKSDQLADLTEVSGSGYARIALSSITVALRGTDDRKATGNEVTFNATGDWTVAYNWFMITPGVASGTWVLVCWDSLTNAPILLTNGESVSVTPVVNANG